MANDVPRKLTDISTRWSAVHEPQRFVLRYASALRRYLEHTVPDRHVAEEVLQEFLLHVSRGGFQKVTGTSGKFRYYLIRSLRNCLVTYYRRQQRHAHTPLPDHLSEAPKDDDRWLREWQQCLLERTWDALQAHEDAHPRSYAYTLLRLRTDHPDADGHELTHLLNMHTQQSHREVAVRKQLSRAREIFAALLVAEVAATMEAPSAADIRAELQEADFLRYVEAYLQA